jgi:electron transport complex protein RnfB
MMDQTPYQQLAARLNSLPSGFPATADGAELRLLEYLYTPEEAALAAQLRQTKETPGQIAARIGAEADDLAKQLKSMAKRGLIAAGRFEDGLRYGLLPFVVGIYENQGPVIDAELARLFEDYYQQSFVHMNAIEPQLHRVIPINESIPIGIEIHPHESAAEIVNQAQAWGVIDCICRKQKALVGDPCEHPVEDTCMVFSQTPGAFDQASLVHALTREEALATLRHAADIGLVHSLGNYREGVSYICNCCTCSCGILRGISEQGLANAVARSPFVSQVDEDLCSSCETCLDVCQFSALALNDAGVMSVNRVRCVGCGQCVINCPDEAISLARRPAEEIKPVPATEHDWGAARAASRGLNLDEIL